MKKYTALILTAVFILSVFSGCGKKDGSSEKSKTDTASSGDTALGCEFYKGDIDLLDADGKAKYRIIRPENGNNAEISSASLIFAGYKKNGITMKNIMDSEPETEYEILIGNTSRKESAFALQYLIETTGGRKDDFVICAVGTKIVIVGSCFESTAAAAEKFVDEYKCAAKITGELLYVNYTDGGDFKELTINGISVGRYNIIRQHYNSSYLTTMAMERLQKCIEESGGYKIDYHDDAYEPESEFEINIGSTNRAGVPAVTNYDTYEVKISGSKVFINGGSAKAVAIAVDEFSKRLAAGSITDADSFEGSYTETVASYDKSTYYTPVFYDDFDGDTISTEVWNICGPNNNSSNGHNGKKSVRSNSPDITFVKDGIFQIWPTYDDEYYYGGMLYTQNKLHFTYGLIEISEKVPDCPGVWTSLWLRCGDRTGLARPEIDINESFGNGNVVAANMHTWPGEEAEIYGIEHTSMDGGTFPQKRRASLDGRSFNEDFHTFGLLWTDESAKFTCDGEVYVEYPMDTKETDHECFSKHMYIVISMATGFENNDSKCEDASEQEWENQRQLYVDWFYLYQLDDGKQVRGKSEIF